MKRAHPPTPTASMSNGGGSASMKPDYHYWDAVLPNQSPSSPFAFSNLPPISYLTRDAIVKMSYITLSHLDSLCKFVESVDPESIQNSQLEIALAIVSRFTHNLDVARPTPNSPRNKVCPSQYEGLPTTPRQRFAKQQRTSSNSLLRTSSKNNMNTTATTTATPTTSPPPAAHTSPSPSNSPSQIHYSHYYNYNNNNAHSPAYRDEKLAPGESSMQPSTMPMGDASAPTTPDSYYYGTPDASSSTMESELLAIVKETSGDEEASTSAILESVMATWNRGVSISSEEETESGVMKEESVDGRRGIKVKAASGEIMILPFRMPSLSAPARVPTPPPVVFSQFYPPQSLTLDSFEIGATLGTGTYGIVKLCKQKSTQNYFALKVINKERIIKLQQKRHIMNEKKILLQLNHPFIVKMYTTFQDAINIYFLMEFVPGGELFSHIRRNAKGYLSNTAACFYAAEIVLAIRYLHSLKIAHRDLKPENILLDEGGHVKLCDFGFAKRINEQAWTMCGTPHYIAPEIILGKGHTKAVDYWSLGIMIYEMLAGHPPFAGSNKLEVFKRIVSNESIEIPQHFQPLAKDLIKRLLVVDNTHRLGYGGVEEVMRHPWFQNIDWDALYHCSLRSPPVQINLGAEGDTSLFPQYPIDEGDCAHQLEDFSLSSPEASGGNNNPNNNFWKGF